MDRQAYKSRGVSSTKDDVKKAVSKQDKGIFPGAFCKIIPDIAGDEDYCSAIHADGAGTKSSVAYLMYKENNEDTSFFEGISQDALVMNTDDLLCVGATNNFYLSNTIGRNAHRVDGKCISALISGYDRFIDEMSKFSINIYMTGGETADVGDLVRTVIADSTVVTRMKRKDVINAGNIKPDDVIVGISSFGKAAYESKENSGIGSNGLTAARHLLLQKKYLSLYPETVSETIPEDKIYCGKYGLDELMPGSKLTVGESILSPTRTYLPVIGELLSKVDRSKISAMIHCTGGGQVKCRDFGNGLCYIKDNLFEWPSIFKTIYDSGEVDRKEMYQIFNMGHRLEIYCDGNTAQDVIETASNYSIQAKVIGRVEANKEKTNKVIIKDCGYVFEY